MYSQAEITFIGAVKYEISYYNIGKNPLISTLSDIIYTHCPPAWLSIQVEISNGPDHCPPNLGNGYSYFK